MLRRLGLLSARNSLVSAMRVELALNLFPNPTSDLQLHEICSLALDGRHRLIIENDRDPAFAAWLGSASDPLRDQWLQTISLSYLFEAHEPARRKVRISARSTSDWTGNVPDLSLNDARNLLRLPFRAILEDWRSDKAFLVAVASPEMAKALAELEKSGGLVFENGGGITNQTQRLAALAARGPEELSRLWAIFDSDALSPGRPSDQSEAARRVCSDNGIPHHRLGRRSIESYVPRESLRGWVFSSPKGISGRRRVFDAFVTLSDDQRHHFNLKHGFQGDSRRLDLANVGTLYDGLPAQISSALDNGFGTRISDIFEHGGIDESSLRREGSWTELEAMVRSLVELVR